MHLQKDDLVALVSPAGALPDTKVVELAQDLLQSWGLKSYTAKHALHRSGVFAGTDTERLTDLQNALDNPQVKMIWALRGGYGCIRIEDQLNFEKFKKHPKLIAGFSDITVLHVKLQQMGYESLHSFMPVQLLKDMPSDVLLQTKHAFLGNPVQYRFKKHSLTSKFESISGVPIGGNLAILYSLLGTHLDFDTNEKILFIEDVGEQLYQIDRMMIALKKSGKLQNLKALLVGKFTDIPENNMPFGKTYQEIILEHAASHYPVIFEAPIGHVQENYPLILGRKVILQNSGSEINLFQPGESS